MHRVGIVLMSVELYDLDAVFDRADVGIKIADKQIGFYSRRKRGCIAAVGADYIVVLRIYEAFNKLRIKFGRTADYYASYFFAIV